MLTKLIKSTKKLIDFWLVEMHTMKSLLMLLIVLLEFLLTHRVEAETLSYNVAYQKTANQSSTGKI